MILLDMLKLLYKKNKKQTQTAESESEQKTQQKSID